jgi:hypothetical protein
MREKEIGEGDSHGDGDKALHIWLPLHVWLPLMMLA